MKKLCGADEKQRRAMWREENGRWKCTSYGTLAYAKHTEHGHMGQNAQRHNKHEHCTDMDANHTDTDRGRRRLASRTDAHAKHTDPRRHKRRASHTDADAKHTRLGHCGKRASHTDTDEKHTTSGREGVGKHGRIPAPLRGDCAR